MKKEKKKPVLKRIMPYAGKRKYMLFLAMFFSALSGILLLMPTWYIHKIVSVMILNEKMTYGMIRGNILYAAILPCIGLCLYVFAGILSHLFAFEVEDNIIKVNVKKVLHKPLGYFADKESGKLRGIIMDGAAETHSVLAHQLPDIASTLVSPAVILVFLFLFDWRLGVASLVPVLVGFVFMATMMSPQGKKKREEYYEHINILSAETVEYVRGIPVVKTFGQSIESFKRLYASILNMKDSVLKMTMGYRNKMSMFEAISGSTAFFLVPTALFIILAGEDPHEVVANSVIYFLIGPIFGVFIMRSATISQYLYFAELALDKIEDVLAYKEMTYGKANQTTGGLEFKNVSFAYDGEKILDNISFKVNKGETVALVGRSGGGKTTIARLAARFYDVDEGKIILGGRNIKDYDKNSLMQNIAFVFQNARLFKMSLRENLLLGKENAADAEIEQALSSAGAKELAGNLKDGLNTVYGAKGTYFSGGEAQRLVIARAFLKDAEFIVLDEATAFADPENEHIIQESFRKLAKNKTTLMIAHRLSTVVNADRILVVENGKITEEGRHEELLKKQGSYKRLWEEYQRSVNWEIGGKNA
ncbi:ABC transporter ATP-binding protein [Ruminococcus sp. AF18-22]|nr:ABC transporter ATP-binding protein [Ruminococcus sp. AF18-22]